MQTHHANAPIRPAGSNLESSLRGPTSTVLGHSKMARSECMSYTEGVHNTSYVIHVKKKFVEKQILLNYYISIKEHAAL